MATAVTNPPILERDFDLREIIAGVEYLTPSPMEILPGFLNPNMTQIKDLALQQTFVYISEGD
jgi:hypothetical protein